MHKTGKNKEKHGVNTGKKFGMHAKIVEETSETGKAAARQIENFVMSDATHDAIIERRPVAA